MMKPPQPIQAKLERYEQALQLIAHGKPLLKGYEAIAIARDTLDPPKDPKCS